MTAGILNGSRCATRKVLVRSALALVSHELTILGSALWQLTADLNLGERLFDIERLLKDCQLNHVDCGQRDHCLPRRLVELSGRAPGSLKARLVFREDLNPRARYFALSYRWGTGASIPYRTTEDNIKQHRSEIPWGLLTIAVQDAMRITYGLKRTYIWVDSLCIIQDDKADWQQEATQMGSIFTGSELTIAAASAEHSHQGLALTVDGPRIYDLENDIAIRWPAASLDLITESALYTRGWVFQEIVLSRRILNICSSQMYWHCCKFLRSEDGGRYSEKYFSHPATINSGSGQGIADKWQELIEHYSKTDFTYTVDRSPAILGPMRMMQAETGKSPIVGLWLETLGTDLAWRCLRRRATQSPLLNGPSWSWMCMDGEVDWYYGGKRPSMLEVLDSQVSWTGEPMLSALEMAMLRIKGQSMTVDLLLRSDNKRLWIAGLHDTIPRIPKIYAPMYIDDLPGWQREYDSYEIPPLAGLCGPCRFLLLTWKPCKKMESASDEAADNGTSSICELAFLMLKQVREDSNSIRFRRIGICGMQLPWNSETQMWIWPEMLPTLEMITLDLV